MLIHFDKSIYPRTFSCFGIFFPLLVIIPPSELVIIPPSEHVIIPPSEFVDRHHSPALRLNSSSFHVCDNLRNVHQSRQQ